jgi:predicted acylesterase/phospholipase RssA
LLPARTLVSLVASIAVVCAVSWPSLPGLPHSANQAYAATKKKAPKAPPKHTPTTQTPAEAAARTPFSAEDQTAAGIAGIPDARAWGDSADDFKRVLPSVNGPWLALSGGGADGAFGAGLLSGWSASGKRPEFAVVTGASIGALISPYAFLGSSQDDELNKNFTEITAADVFEDKSTPESLFDTWPLKKLIEKRVSMDMLTAIAAEHRKGRRLLVVTTNLDAGRRVIWNMGAIAERGDERALKLFRDVLLASSSIPGFFQPVAIDVEANGKKFQEMHLDGTITAPFFIAPESIFSTAGARLPTSQIYVIVNSKLASDFSMPERNVKMILARTIGVALTTELRAELLLTTVAAQRLGLGLDAAYVPDTFQQVNRSLFDREYMEALYKLGAERAKNGTAFETITTKSLELRTGAPQ